MDYNLKWLNNDLEIVVVLGTFIIGFLAYLYLKKSEKIFNSFKKKYAEDKALEYWVHFQRLIGVIFYGIIPVILIVTVLPQRMTDYGIILTKWKPTMLWWLILTAIIIPMNIYNGNKPDNLAMYPQIRTKEWNLRIFISSALSWIAYLVAYEFAVRGFLFYSCIRAFGVWPAILINIVIYSLIHVPKGRKEAIGAIPLGLILCTLTITTGSFWLALLAHMSLALANEWSSLYYNPDINYIKKK